MGSPKYTVEADDQVCVCCLGCAALGGPGVRMFERAIIKRADSYGLPFGFDMDLWNLRRQFPDWDFRMNAPKYPDMGLDGIDVPYRSIFTFGNDNRKYEAILTSAESDIQN